MLYVVVFEINNETTVSYCDSIEQVDQEIGRLTTTPEERKKVRIFRTIEELRVQEKDEQPMTLLDPKIRTDAALRGYADSILVILSVRFGEINKDEIRNKLSKIQEEEQMKDLIGRIADSDSLEEFLKYI
jgi:hypothetical protein